MFKRPRSASQDDVTTSETSVPPLGASEFAAVLNGDDPQAILNVLKRFVKTVRKERRVALSVFKEDVSRAEEGDDESDSTGSESDDDSVDGDHQDPGQEGGGQKRFRKDEAWKEDTSNYAVPFVGTSYSRGSAGKVVPGQWPTGVLKEYLTKSPMAVELSGDALIPGIGRIHKTLIRRKHGRASHALYKLYLQALAELVTAAIPIEKLVTSKAAARTNSVDDDDDDGSVETESADQQSPQQSFRFLSELVKRRLPGLLTLLKEETSSGKGKAEIVGGCGVLAQFSLRILTNLSMVSNSMARTVARGIEQGIPEGVLRFLLKHQTTNKRQVTEQNIDDDGSTRPSTRELARAAAIDLATSLVRMHHDAVVFSCISSPGARDRKIPPGILFLALKEGLVWVAAGSSKSESGRGADEVHSILNRSLKALLKATRELLAARRSSINMDVFSRDSMQNLTQLTLCAPRLTDDNSYEQVLSASDRHEGITSLQLAGVEARRLLFALLASPDLSPLLRATKAKTRFALLARQQAVRCFVLLLDGDHTLGIQRFVLRAISVTPALLPVFFRSLTFPDAKKTFPFLARLNLVSLLVRQGPTPQQCLGDSGRDVPVEDDDMVSVLLPQKLKKQTMTKALQSRQPLIVSEVLKLLVFVLARSHVYLHATRDANGPFFRRLTTLVDDWIPEATSIFSLMQQVDHSKPSSTILLCHACDVILGMNKTMPQLLAGKDFKLDWTKLLSAENGFERKPLFLQVKVLKMLPSLFDCQQMSSASKAKSCRRMIEILVATQSPRIMSMVRGICLKLMLSLIPSRGKEAKGRLSFEYEFGCWLDGVTTQSLDELITCLQEASVGSFRMMIQFARAWQGSELPKSVPLLPVSSLVIYALHNLPRASKSFALLTLQVAAKCLLYLENPLPLSVVIQDAHSKTLGESSTEVPYLEQLAQYASSMIRFEETSGTERHKMLVTLFDLLFSKGSFQRLFLKAEDPLDPDGSPTIFAHSDVIVLVRNLTHIVTATSGASGVGGTLLKRLLTLAPLALVRDGFGVDDLKLLRGCLYRASQQDFDTVTLIAALSWEPRGEEFLDFVSDRNSIRGLSTLLSRQGTLPISRQSEQVYLCFVRPLLPSSVLVQRLGTLLENIAERSSKSQLPLLVAMQFLCEVLDVAGPFNSLESNLPDYYDLARSLVKLWTKSSCGGSGLAMEKLLDVIENVLCFFLRSEGMVSSIALAALSDCPDEVVVTRCLEGERARSGQLGDRQQCSLLSALVESDTVRFGSQLLHQLARFPSYQVLCGNSCLDNAFLSVVQRGTAAGDSDRVLQLWKEELVSRSCDALNHFPERSFAGLSFEALPGLIHAEELEPAQSNKLVNALADYLSDNFLSGNVELPLPTHELLLESAVQLCCSVPDVPQADGTRLSTKLLLHLCKLTLSALRSNLAKQRSADLNVMDATRLLTWTRQVLQKGLLSAESAGPSGLKSFYSVIRSCLRHGLGMSESLNGQMMSLCLGVVKSFVEAGSGDNGVGLLFASKPLAAQVFEMVTTHSAFHLLHEDSIYAGYKLEVIRLLRFCISRTKEIQFDSGVSRALLQCFQAGVSEIDLELRTLLLEYWRLADSEDAMCMDQMQWGNNRKRAKGNLEWLVGSLDSVRVHDTLCSFPIGDSVDPTLAISSDTSEPSWLDAMDEKKAIDKRRSSKPYSPGYLLPLVLAALESSCSSLLAIQKGNSSSVETVKIGESTVSVVQRLCDKDVVSLSLMALCSSCQQLRRVSVSILGLVGTVLRSQEAVESGSWRERPQLAMILESVQRALAQRLSKNQGKYSVPQLPGVVTIFLARSFLVASRPGDRLYAAVNRVFLRIQANHGSFQDLGRLPAFITLLCSSADESEQVSSERAWALNFLRDGFLDQSCYKPLVACHGTELLLTSLSDSRWRLSGEKHKELPLLLRVLHRVVSRGGEKCEADFIKRVGLVSFLRSLVSEKQLCSLLPSLESHIVLLQLVEVTVRKAGGLLSRNDFVAATAGFADIVISFCVGSPLVDPQAESGVANTPAIATHVAAVLTSLAFPGVDDAKSVSHIDAGPVADDGIALANASAFLTAQRAWDMSKALTAVCRLPSRCAMGDEVEAASLCIQVLKEAQAVIHGRNVALAYALRKVSELATFFAKSFDEGGSVLRLVLVLRRPCSASPEALKAWNVCVSCMVAPKSEENSERDLLSGLGRKLTSRRQV